MKLGLRILYLGSDETVARSLEQAFERSSDTLLQVHDPREALWLLDEQHFDRVVVEVGSAAFEPEALIEQILSRAPRIGALVLARRPDFEESVRLARLGAQVYLPLEEATIVGPEQLAERIRQLDGPLDELTAAEGEETAEIPELVGSSPAMTKVIHLVQLIAPRQSTVLISGRTGTGKELVDCLKVTLHIGKTSSLYAL